MSFFYNYSIEYSIFFSGNVALPQPSPEQGRGSPAPSSTVASTHEVTLYVVFGVVLIVFIVIIVVVIKVMKNKNASPAYTLTSTGEDTFALHFLQIMCRDFCPSQIPTT